MKKIQRFDGEIYRRSSLCIAHGALTNSKRPESFVKGVYPTHLTKAQGCKVWDTQGNEYVDFICGLGTNLLGYANTEITDAITRQAQKGTVLSLGTEIEVRAAERLKEFFPFVERLRFLKTGSDAATAACIIARSHKKMPHGLILSEGYHGWHPEFVSLTPPAHGVMPRQEMRPLRGEFPWGVNMEEVAAIIVEPVVTDWSQKRIDWLRRLREMCTEKGIVLIFDEVITGIRFPTYSVAQEHGVVPDLICLGKAIGGGMPLSVVAGRAQIMEGDYFVSSTFAGETLSLAACLKTLDLVQNKHSIPVLWERGKAFLSRFNAIWPEGVTIEGYPTRGVFVGEPMTKALFMEQACHAGILVGPSFFLCFPHLDILDDVLSTFRDILLRIKTGQCTLRGEMPQSPFAQKVRTQNE